jgi:septal ring factor EnvC (AmiA/AmiB activator)
METDESAELRLLIQSNRGLIESLEDAVRRLESRSYEANSRLDDLEAKVRSLRGLPPPGTGMP